MYSYVVQFRTIVLKGVFPDIKWILYGFTVALISLVVGSIVFLKHRINLFYIFRRGKKMKQNEKK